MRVLQVRKTQQKKEHWYKKPGRRTNEGVKCTDAKVNDTKYGKSIRVSRSQKSELTRASKER